MPAMKLTKSIVEGLKPDPARDVWAWDETLPGFGVRVKPSGAKSFLIQYRTRQGVGRKFTLGSVALIPLQEAREKARRLLIGVRDGEDPQASLKADRTAQTLNDAFERFDSEHISKRLKPSSQVSYRALYDRYVRQTLGKRPLDSITRGDIVSFHASLSSSPYSANRTLALLTKLFNVAETDWQILKAGNPARRIKKFAEEKRDRILSSDELARLWNAFDKFEEKSPHRAPLARFFRLTLLTGTRKGEWLDAKWSNVDFERSLLVLSDSKTGAKLVEIPAPALELLRTMREEMSEPLRFSRDLFVLSLDRGRSPIKYPYTAWREITALAELEPGFRIHDLRHVFGSYAHRNGASQRTVAELLGHKTLAMTDRYIQGFSEARRQAANATAEAILKSTRQGTSVSPVSKRRQGEPQTGATVSELPSKGPRPRKTKAR